MNLPIVHPDREPMTEEEARRVGNAAWKLARLRQMLKEAQAPRSGHLTVGIASAYGSATSSFSLNSLDLEAIIALLIEREAAFLASFNVTVEKSE